MRDAFKQDRDPPMTEPRKRASKAAERPAETGEDAAETEHEEAEIGGPSGPDPTRYGDWERKGICVDF